MKKYKYLLWIRGLRAFLLGSLSVTTAVAAAAAEGGPPSRIVSINVCADNLLLALSDPSQIVALSPYSVDPQLSFLADEATNFRHDAAEAETVIELDPDLVLAGRFTKLATRTMLSRLGYRVVLLDPARSIEQAIAQIRDVAALVGHAERGESLIGRIKTAGENARAVIASLEARPSAAVYQRRGYVTGSETLATDLMAVTGIDNIGGTLAGRFGGFVPLERLVDTRPDVLIVAAADARAEDQGSALLAHPALQRLYPSERRMILPERLTVCGGPSLPAALERLAAEVDRIAGPQ